MFRRKNAEEKPKRRRGIGMIKIILIFALLTGLIVVFSHYFCTLKNISIEGSNLYTNDQIARLIITDEHCTNALYAWGKCKIRPIKNLEFIDSVDVKMTDLHSLKAYLKPKDITGYVEGRRKSKDGGEDTPVYIYFDFDGEINEISDKLLKGVMRVEGVICEAPKKGKVIDIGSARAGYLLALLSQLKKYDIDPIEIKYEETGSIVVVLETMDIDVGMEDFLEQKISRLEYIMPQLKGQVGVLHLENFSEENTDIIFEKTDEITAREASKVTAAAAADGTLTQDTGDEMMTEGAVIDYIEME